MKKVLIFGIFDGIHPGHVSFLRQAKKCGNFLVAAVGRASACKKIKCKIPKLSLKNRIKGLLDVSYVYKAVPGDIEQGSYKVILREKPDIICLGYDQRELAKDLNRWKKERNSRIKIVPLKPYKPNTYHTAILRNKEK